MTKNPSYFFPSVLLEYLIIQTSSLHLPSPADTHSTLHISAELRFEKSLESSI